MRVSGKSTDYLRISPSRALWSVCAQLILVNLVLAVTTTLTNRLYSQYAGQTYFTVTGYLSVATTLFVNVVSSVYTAAWIKIAHQFAPARPSDRDTRDEKRGIYGSACQRGLRGTDAAAHRAGSACAERSTGVRR